MHIIPAEAHLYPGLGFQPIRAGSPYHLCWVGHQTRPDSDPTRYCSHVENSNRDAKMRKMYSKMVFFRVWQKENRLIPLCRGLQGGSSGRGLVRNGGLWWPELMTEGDGLCCGDAAAGLLSRRRVRLCCWSWGGDDGDGTVVQGGWNWWLKIFAPRGGERDEFSGFRERERQRKNAENAKGRGRWSLGREGKRLARKKWLCNSNLSCVFVALFSPIKQPSSLSPLFLLFLRPKILSVFVLFSFLFYVNFSVKSPSLLLSFFSQHCVFTSKNPLSSCLFSSPTWISFFLLL